MDQTAGGELLVEGNLQIHGHMGHPDQVFCIAYTNRLEIFANRNQDLPTRTIPYKQIENVIPKVNPPSFDVYLEDGNVLKFQTETTILSQRWTIALLSDPDPENKISFDNLREIKVIGRGRTAKVVQVRDKSNGDFYAVKSVRKESDITGSNFDRILIEKEILMSVSHPFIVRMFGCFQTDKRFKFILEYLEGGDLRSYFDRVCGVPITQVTFIAAEITSAINFLHNKGFVYRDLKPENILLDSKGHIRLTDFGLSNHIMDNNSSFSGTTEYAAPEIFQKRNSGIASDWWSLGIIIYEMLTGMRPFANPDQAINATLSIPPMVDEKAANLISGLLEKNPQRRFTYRDVVSSDFFAEIDWERLEQMEYPMDFIPPMETTQHDETGSPAYIPDSFAGPIAPDVYHLDGFSWESDIFQ